MTGKRFTAGLFACAFFVRVFWLLWAEAAAAARGALHARRAVRHTPRAPSSPSLTMGKVHGSLARAGKVRGQTPKVAKQEKSKRPKGRAWKRTQYNRRFVTAVVGFGKKRGPNSNQQ